MSGNPYPQVFSDGSWAFTDAPALVVFEDAPGQGDPANGVAPFQAGINWYGAGPSWGGNIEAHHVINIPPIIPNLGIPGTSFNISDLFMGGLFQDFIAQVARTLGGTPLAVAIYEYRIQQAGPDLLGYEVELLIQGAPAVGQAMAFRGPSHVQAQTIGPVIIGAGILVGAVLAGVPAWVALIAAGVSLDVLTGGAVSAALGSAIDRISGGASKVLQAPAKGATEILLVGIGAVFALSWFLGKQEQRGTPFDFSAAKSVASTGSEIGRGLAQPTPAQITGPVVRRFNPPPPPPTRGRRS